MSKRAKKLALQFKAYVLGSYRAQRTLMDPYVQAGRTEVDALVMVQIHQLNVYAIVMISSFILMILEGILEQVLLIPEADGLGPIWAVVCIIPATIVSFGMVMTILRRIKCATA